VLDDPGFLQCRVTWSNDAGERTALGATAIAHRATLVHKDPEFETFKEISQEVLK
jgi:hypothetical protein